MCFIHMRIWFDVAGKENVCETDIEKTENAVGSHIFKGSITRRLHHTGAILFDQ